jgi:threonine/homoserine/homoserine lactone efflux protein
LLLFFKGIAIGLAIAAPVGPVAVLCIRRTLAHGIAQGFATGIGAVTADVFFGSAASFGVAAVSGLVLTYENWLRSAGGLFMLVLGVRTYFQKSKPSENQGTSPILRAYGTAFFLTITNPITIFAFTAIFAGFGVVSDNMSVDDTLSLMGGVTVGCIAWWCGMTLITNHFRARFSNDSHVWLHHLSGGLLVLFGIASIGSLLFNPPHLP